VRGALARFAARVWSRSSADRPASGRLLCRACRQDLLIIVYGRIGLGPSCCGEVGNLTGIEARVDSVGLSGVEEWLVHLAGGHVGSQPVMCGRARVAQRWRVHYRSGVVSISSEHGRRMSALCRRIDQFLRQKHIIFFDRFGNERTGIRRSGRLSFIEAHLRVR